MSKNKIMRRLLASLAAGAAAASLMLVTEEYWHDTTAHVTACVELGDFDTQKGISDLNTALHDKKLLKEALVAPWIDEDELSAAVKVTPFGRSAAQISLTGLEHPEEASIILITLMHEFSKTEYADNYRIISYCDAKKSPSVPADRLSISAGLIFALIIFLASAPKKTSEKISDPEKTSEEVSAPEKTINEAAAPMKPVNEPVIQHEGEKHREDNAAAETKAIQKTWEVKHRNRLSAENIGKVDMNAPKGLELSGHLEAAEKLRISAEKCGVRTFAVASGNSAVFSSSKEIISLFASYLACALGEQGCRTMIVECDLKNPSLGKIFGKYGKGGVAEIVAQSCTVMDAVVMNVRKGVDIIAETKPAEDPAAVLSSPHFKNLVQYLSGQYDILLMTCPKAWDGEEWDIVLSCCGGTVTVLEDSLTPDSACEQGLKNSNGKINHICSVKAIRTDRKG